MLLTFVPFIPTRFILWFLIIYFFFLFFMCMCNVQCTVYSVHSILESQAGVLLSNRPYFNALLTIGTMISYVMLMRYIIVEGGMFRPNMWVWYELVFEGKMMNKLIASYLLHPLPTAHCMCKIDQKTQFAWDNNVECWC